MKSRLANNINSWQPWPCAVYKCREDKRNSEDNRVLEMEEPKQKDGYNPEQVAGHNLVGRPIPDDKINEGDRSDGQYGTAREQQPVAVKIEDVEHASQYNHRAGDHRHLRQDREPKQRSEVMFGRWRCIDRYERANEINEGEQRHREQQDVVAANEM